MYANNLNGSQGNYAEWKETISKSYVLYDSIYVAFLKWQNYRDEEQSSDCRELRREEREEVTAITGSQQRSFVSCLWWWSHKSTCDKNYIEIYVCISGYKTKAT